MRKTASGNAVITLATCARQFHLIAECCPGYYFVDHGSRKLFWPEEYEQPWLFEEVKGLTELPHIGMQSEKTVVTTQSHSEQNMLLRGSTGTLICAFPRIIYYSGRLSYRAHWALFPIAREIPLALVVELREIVLYAVAGMLHFVS